MQHAEFLCGLAIVVVGTLCYVSGWTSRALWSALAIGVTIVQISISRSFGCPAAMIVVSVICACAGHFDRKR
jgi:hypothetical protein